MGIFEDIFGGGSNTSQSTSTPSNQNPFTSALQAPVTNEATSLLQNGLPQYTPNSNLAAPITSAETSDLSNLQSMTAPNNSSTSYLNGVLAGNYLPGGSQQNPFLSAAVTAAQRGTMNDLNDTLSKSLPGQFLAAGQNTNPTNGSSAFDTAGALYASRSAQSMADIATNMNNSAYTTERANQQQAVGLQQQEVQTTINNLQAQALPRLIQQYGIDEGLQQFQAQTSQLLQLLGTAGGIAAPVIGNTTQSTGTATQETGIVPALGGGKGIAAGIAAM